MDTIGKLLKTLFFETPTRAVIFLLILAVGGLILFLVEKIKQASELKNSVKRLTHSFDELDEQAKLIVKTDLELNRARDELDKRLTALNALQKTSRLISTTLDTEEIFRRLDRSLMTGLGFEKSLLLMFDKKKDFVCRLESGFPKEGLEGLLTALGREHSIMTSVFEGRSLSSLSSAKQKKEKITQLFGVEHFILSPILSQDGVIGLILAANTASGQPITQSDEELMAILCNQIGQSIENALLFEEAYRARQELETKIQERTKELENALTELKKISKAKSEFVSAVSHELRTPLTSIKGYASLLMAGKAGEVPEEVKERLNKIDKHSDNLVKLINDLLDISRIESGRVEMKYGECRAGEIIDNVRDLLTPQMKDKNIHFSGQIPPDLPPLKADRNQIERVLINLVGNAVKFTPTGGTITVKAERQNDVIRFEVSDTGIGIAQDDIVKLFHEFYRVENEINQTVKGTGLGLALARNIIEAHHGKIGVASRINQGTTFHFELPLAGKS